MWVGLHAGGRGQVAVVTARGWGPSGCGIGGGAMCLGACPAVAIATSLKTAPTGQAVGLWAGLGTNGQGSVMAGRATHQWVGLGIPLRAPGRRR